MTAMLDRDSTTSIRVRIALVGLVFGAVLLTIGIVFLLFSFFGPVTLDECGTIAQRGFAMAAAGAAALTVSAVSAA